MNAGLSCGTTGGREYRVRESNGDPAATESFDMT